MPTTLVPRRIGGRTFDFARRTAVMAVVNRTPDSFYDAGSTYALDAAVAKATEAVRAGADWVDIGGVPFSPDTPEVSPEEELSRVLPVVEALAADSDVVISVDTYTPEVATACLAAGASVINDVTGLRNPDLAEVIADSEATVVIAHSLAEPHRHLRRPQYQDVVTEIRDFLLRRVDVALSAGIPPERIVIDPGHDLNKNTMHSLEITGGWANSPAWATRYWWRYRTRISSARPSTGPAPSDSRARWPRPPCASPPAHGSSALTTSRKPSTRYG